MAAGMIGGSVLDSWVGADSQHKANRTNLRIWREQRDYDREMQNSAMQRRVADLRAAGLNPVLAAGGPGAGATSQGPPSIEPTYRPGTLNASQSLAAAESIRNLRANTEKTNAETAGIKMRNNVYNAFGQATEEANLAIKLHKSIIMQTSEEKLRAEINNVVKQGLVLDQTNVNLALTGAQTAQQVQQFERTKDDLAQLLMQQVKKGKLELDALENFAKAHGIETDRILGIMERITGMISDLKSPIKFK